MFAINLENKVAAVTGGARGIGRAIIEHLVEAGANVVFNDYQDPGNEIADAAAAKGRKVIPLQGDVSKTEDCEKLIQTAVKEFGKIDILVNNAGITRDNLLMRMSEQEWDSVLATNLRSVFACSRAAVKPMMKARSGCIINISSISGLTGLPGQCNYAASKAGIVGFTKALAREVSTRGIRVNAVAPGFIRSVMTDALPEDVRAAAQKEIPLGVFGEPADIAGAILYLSSPLARFVTGQVLVVDGGMAM